MPGGVSCMAGWKKEPVRSEMENERAPRKKTGFSLSFSLFRVAFLAGTNAEKEIRISFLPDHAAQKMKFRTFL